MSGVAALNAEITRLRALAASGSQLAPKVAEAALAVIRENVAAGRGPDGEAWPLTAKGEKALQNAGSALSAYVSGSRVVLQLVGPEVWHHKGKTRGSIARPILPSKRMPQPMIAAMQRVARDWFEGRR